MQYERVQLQLPDWLPTFKRIKSLLAPIVQRLANAAILPYDAYHDYGSLLQWHCNMGVHLRTVNPLAAVVSL